MEIVRIVRLSFIEDKVPDFIDIFENSKLLIKAFEGCQALRLYRDHLHQNVFIHTVCGNPMIIWKNTGIPNFLSLPGKRQNCFSILSLWRFLLKNSSMWYKLCDKNY